MMDTGFLESLSRLKLSLKHNTTMNMSGNRKSTQKGTSTEFSGFREYLQGDDLRRIDWNAYGRLNKLYIKEYMEEKETCVQILVDTSASMHYDTPFKEELAKKLALSFSYMALNNMDRVILYDLQKPEKPYFCMGGKKSIALTADFIDKMECNGSVGLPEILPKLSYHNNGITVLISDFWEESFLRDPESFKKMLRFLKYKKQQIILLHILSGKELHIDLTGTLNLIDLENKTNLRVTMENRSIKEYEKCLLSYLEMLRNTAKSMDATYCLCDSSEDFKKIIFEKLRFAYDI